MRRIFFLHQFTLEFHGGGELFIFGCQLVLKQEEFFDLFDPRKLLVHPVQLLLNQRLHFRGARQAGVVAEGHVLVLRKFFHVFLVDHDDDGQVGELVANHHRIGHIG